MIGQMLKAYKIGLNNHQSFSRECPAWHLLLRRDDLDSRQVMGLQADPWLNRVLFLRSTE